MKAASGGAPIWIDQMVHGYDRGHRLVRSSRTVDDESGQLMRAMSDLLTPRLLTDGESYLAGYPIKRSAAFVLARTWAATDMPRPGSVWTHSLILDYQVLTTLEDPSAIAKLLQQPSTATLENFSSPLSLETRPPLGREDAWNDHPSVRSALAALYDAEPAPRISVAHFDSRSDESLFMALWRQAWPALRRDIAFVTALDPKLPKLDASCTMLLTAQPRQSFEQSASDARIAIQSLVDDLPNRQQTELRAFIGRHAFDAVNPRAAVLPLVGLWQQLKNANAADLATAVNAVRKHITSPRLSRDVIDRLLVPPVTTEMLTEFVRQFGSLDLGGTIRALERLDYTTLEGDLSPAFAVSTGAAEGTVGAQAFAHLASELPTSKLAALRLSDDDALRLAESRPETLHEPSFWLRSDASRASLVGVASRCNIPLEIVAHNLGSDLGSAVVPALTSSWPDQAPGLLLGKLSETVLQTKKTADGAAIAAFLGRSPELVREAVAGGTRVSALAADAVVAAAFTAAMVTRPAQAYWLSLTEPQPRLNDAPSLAALTLCAALTSASRDTMAILRAFPIVEAAAANRALPRSTEQYLEQTFRDLHIFTLRLTDGVMESAIRAVLSSEGSAGRLLTAVDGRRQVNAILEAIYKLAGLTAVWEVTRSAEKLIEPKESWKLYQANLYLTSKEKKKWFW